MGSLCTGYGGLDLGVLTAFGGGRIAWVADPDPHVALILATRMPGTPNLGDLRRIDWSTVEPVDLLTAGWPCQDISAAGKRAGIEKGARSGLWTDIVAGVRLLRPALVVLENVAALRRRNGGLHRVLGNLAEAGYDALWRSVRASDIGAAHRRERVFLLAWRRPPRHDRSAGTDHLRQLLLRRQPEPTTTEPLTAAAYPAGLRHRHPGTQGRPRVQTTAVAAGAPPDAHSQGTATDEPSTTPPQGVTWGAYQAAIHHWESLLGRPTPHPTEPDAHGRPVLAPAFVEHLMGLPAGWITDLPLPRTAQLRALGNGVVPAQATHAVSLLLDDLATVLAPGGHREHEKVIAA